MYRLVPFPPPPTQGGQREFRGEGDPKGGNFRGDGGLLTLVFFFPGGLSKIGELFINNGFSVEQAVNYLPLPVFQSKYYCLH